MKLTCDVIRDLLPLYAEGLASADTAALVEEHLAACKGCQKALAELRKPVQIPMDTVGAPLRRIRNAMKRRRVWTALFSVCLFLAAMAAAFGWLTAPEYLPYTYENIALTHWQDDTLTVRLGTQVSGYSVFSEPLETGGGEVLRITAWSSVWNRLTGGRDKRNIVLNPDGERVDAAYYFAGYDPYHHWLYGEGDETIATPPNRDLAALLIIALGLAAALLATAMALRRRKPWGGALRYAALLPVSYLLAHLLIKGTSVITYAFPRDILMILLMAAPILGVLALVMYRLSGHGGKACI